MIAVVLFTILGVHLFWATVLVLSFWWMSRDPKPRGILPFKKVAR